MPEHDPPAPKWLIGSLSAFPLASWTKIRSTIVRPACASPREALRTESRKAEREPPGDPEESHLAAILEPRRRRAGSRAHLTAPCKSTPSGQGTTLREAQR
jgi:hypothetical protein